MFPYLYQPESPSVSVVEGGTADISCYLLVGTETNNTIVWEWTFHNDLLLDTSGGVGGGGKYSIDSAHAANSTLTVKNAVESDRGDYYCIGKNEFGSNSRKIALRVKSESTKTT